MGIFLIAVVSSALIFLTISQVIKNLYGPGPHEQNCRSLPIILTSAIFHLLLNTFAGSVSQGRILLCISIALAGIQPLSSSVIPSAWQRVIAFISSGLQGVFALLFVFTDCLWHLEMPAILLRYFTVVFCSVPGVMMIAGVFRRVRDMKVVLRSGSVWNMLCISVDAVYVSAVLLYALLIPLVWEWVSALLLFSIAAALCIRIRNHSVFVCMSSHERCIVESMRLAHSDCVGDNTGEDVLYDNIYERVSRYFETERPYLNTNLTINDVVDSMYTNRLYISKAISHCTGRNFCQFVNYHRVTYAVELFRGNPQLKVVEMATLSGFNSTTTFNSAFRLYMGEKPGEWCRRERNRLIKK